MSALLALVHDAKFLVNGEDLGVKDPLLVPRWMGRPDQPPDDCQVLAAPTSPLSWREPLVQMASRRLHSLAVARARALSSMTTRPVRRQPVLRSHASTVSMRRRAAACGEGGALPGQDLLRPVAVTGSGIEALGKPGLMVVQQRPGGYEAGLAGDDAPRSRLEGAEHGSSRAVDGQLVLILDALLSLPSQLGRIDHISRMIAYWRCVCVLSLYIYPATFGPAGPRQLLAFLYSVVPPLSLSPSHSPPPERDPADMVRLPGYRCTLKYKQRIAKPTTKQTKQHPLTLLPWRRPPPPAPPFANFSGGGPCPPILPFHLGPWSLGAPSALSPSPSLSCSPPRGGISDHLPYPRFTEEGQDRFGRSLVAKQQSHPGSPRVFLLAAYPLSFQNSWIWVLKASQFTKRWWRVCLSSWPHHQHLSDGSLCILLHK